MTMVSILDAVSRAHKLNPRVLKGERRDKNAVSARRVFIRLAHEDGYSAAAIGRFINLDHTTVLYHLKSFEGGAA